MPNESYARTMRRLRIRSRAVEANLGEVPQLKDPLQRLNALLARADDLFAKQAALTAAKQEVSKELGRRESIALDDRYPSSRSSRLAGYCARAWRNRPSAERGSPTARRVFTAST